MRQNYLNKFKNGFCRGEDGMFTGVPRWMIYEGYEGWKSWKDKIECREKRGIQNILDTEKVLLDSIVCL